MIETVALAGTVIGYLVKTLKENKDYKSFASDFTSAAMKWIRPIFLSDDGEQPTTILTDLKNDPDDILAQESAKIEIAKLVKNNPVGFEHLQQIVNQINNIESGLTSGYSVTQTHFGSGDNIGRDKVTK
jgi:hypothetical protein